MSLDHGTLNIPLSKRGNIDAQIDRYKADQAREANAARKERAAEVAELRIKAKALFAAADADQVAALAARFGISRSEMRSKLKSDAHWLPAQVIALLSKAKKDRARANIKALQQQAQKYHHIAISFLDAALRASPEERAEIGVLASAAQRDAATVSRLARDEVAALVAA